MNVGSHFAKHIIEGSWLVYLAILFFEYVVDIFM